MKKTSKSMIFVSVIAISTFAFILLVNAQGVKEWIAPAKYKTMKNPVTSNKENIANGKELYSKHCKSCHGSAGLGDGPKAATLDVPCGDFTTKKFHAQADGEIFFKISEGREKMPSFKKTIPDDNDRWAIIHYLRTFAGK
jgi:mono/diheme cytochrome c family protein